MTAIVHIDSGLLSGACVEVAAERFSIGSGERDDVVLDAREARPAHAVLQCTDDGRLRLASAGGDVQAEDGAALRPGDLLPDALPVLIGATRVRVLLPLRAEPRPRPAVPSGRIATRRAAGMALAAAAVAGACLLARQADSSAAMPGTQEACVRSGGDIGARNAALHDAGVAAAVLEVCPRQLLAVGAPASPAQALAARASDALQSQFPRIAVSVVPLQAGHVRQLLQAAPLPPHGLRDIRVTLHAATAEVELVFDDAPPVTAYALQDYLAERLHNVMGVRLSLSRLHDPARHVAVRQVQHGSSPFAMLADGTQVFEGAVVGRLYFRYIGPDRLDVVELGRGQAPLEE
jgi:hypothetical protein